MARGVGSGAVEKRSGEEGGEERQEVEEGEELLLEVPEKLVTEAPTKRTWKQAYGTLFSIIAQRLNPLAVVISNSNYVRSNFHYQLHRCLFHYYV